MTRSVAALVLLVAFTAVGFGWRTLVQVRRHGDTGWRFDRTGPDRLVGPALVASFALLGIGPLVAVVSGLDPLPGLTTLVAPGPAATAATVVGILLVLGGGTLTVVAQLQMGASWRIGVRAGERTALVTGGLFSVVRNPIFTAMLAVAVGIALLVPSALTVLGAVVAIATIEAQVRVVEEPNLLAVHGDEYRRWAARTGRFLPAVGRLAPA